MIVLEPRDHGLHREQVRGRAPLDGVEATGGAAGAVGQKAEDGVADNEYNAMMSGGTGATKDKGGQGGMANNQSIYQTCTQPGQEGSAHTGGKPGLGGNCMALGKEAAYEKGGLGSGNGHGGGGGAAAATREIESLRMRALRMVRNQKTRELMG